MKKSVLPLVYRVWLAALSQPCSSAVISSSFMAVKLNYNREYGKVYTAHGLQSMIYHTETAPISLGYIPKYILWNRWSYNPGGTQTRFQVCYRVVFPVCY
jgi:hypothetical protein